MRGRSASTVSGCSSSGIGANPAGGRDELHKPRDFGEVLERAVRSRVVAEKLSDR
jgi:hypothetical protein